MSSLFVQDLFDSARRVPDRQLGAYGSLLKRYGPHADTIAANLYDRLPRGDQQRLITWMLLRWAGINTVNPIEMAAYRADVETVKTQPCERMELNGNVYKLLDLNPQGCDFKILTYEWMLAIHDVLYNQYECGDIRIETGDVIIDAGAFVGDTAALFAHKTGNDCKVHSFEILDDNLKLLLHNAERNGFESLLTVNKMALSDKSGGRLGVERGSLEGGTKTGNSSATVDTVETVTLDDYVVAMDLREVDFIKMDIEGGEAPALRGAIHTIRQFKPKLAICLYHLWDDIITIPDIIARTGVEYQFRFKWVQLQDGWEAVLLAKPA